MKRSLCLFLFLLASCATPQESATEQQLQDIQQQLDQLLQLQLSEFSPIIVRPPLGVPASNDPGFQLQITHQSEQQPASSGTHDGVGSYSETPQVHLELDGTISGGVKLKMSIPNPIGGPTVHHYELRQISSRWSLVHTGSSEYL